MQGPPGKLLRALSQLQLQAAMDHYPLLLLPPALAAASSPMLQQGSSISLNEGLLCSLLICLASCQPGEEVVGDG